MKKRSGTVHNDAIVAFCSGGKTAKEVAEHIGISYSTVHSYLSELQKSAQIYKERILVDRPSGNRGITCLFVTVGTEITHAPLPGQDARRSVKSERQYRDPRPVKTEKKAPYEGLKATGPQVSKMARQPLTIAASPVRIGSTALLALPSRMGGKLYYQEGYAPFMTRIKEDVTCRSCQRYFTLAGEHQ